jgi:hypothetical protein
VIVRGRLDVAARRGRKRAAVAVPGVDAGEERRLRLVAEGVEPADAVKAVAAATPPDSKSASAVEGPEPREPVERGTHAVGLDH